MAYEKVNFDIAYKQLLERWEDPHYTGKITTDAGGKTRYGISEAAYPSLDISSLTLVRAKEITLCDYWNNAAWDISSIDSAYQCLANKLFQFGFNVGVGTVIQIANLCLYITNHAEYNALPRLGDHLVISDKAEVICMGMTEMLAAAQLSRYIKDYHILARVPHSLLDRALCIE